MDRLRRRDATCAALVRRRDTCVPDRLRTAVPDRLRRLRIAVPDLLRTDNQRQFQDSFLIVRGRAVA